MPYYKVIGYSTPEGKRTAERLMVLKQVLDTTVPPKTTDTTLLIASWNIREFGGTKSDGREQEPLFYLAEILSHFDLIAVQEVRDNLDALDGLMRIMGGWWKYLVSDVTLGKQGNGERSGYIYDSRKISFGGLAGELVPPMTKTDGRLQSSFAFARSPYLAGFQAGWFKFTICTDHFYWGEDTANDPQRVEEARAIVKLVKDRMKSKDAWAYNTILLGDFNVFTMQDQTIAALEKEAFHIPDNLKGKYTNANLDRPYDQMAFVSSDKNTQLNLGTAKAGVFDYYQYVYRDEDHQIYRPDLDMKRYKQWRTFKMSDHLPIWVEVNVDFGQAYLKRKVATAPAVAPSTPTISIPIG